MHYQPLEFTVAGRKENQCYIKLVCNKSDKVSHTSTHSLTHTHTYTYKCFSCKPKNTHFSSTHRRVF